MDKRSDSWFILFFLLLVLFFGSVKLLRAEQLGGGQYKSVLPHQGETGFQGLWVQRLEAMSGKGASVGEQQLEEIIKLKLDRGILNLWEYALLLVREGTKLKDKKTVVKLGEFSQRMAPDLPHVYFYGGQMILEKDRWNVYPAVQKYFDGIRAYTRNLPLALGKCLNLLHLLGLGALLAVLAFCSVVLFKRLPIYIHALKQELQGPVKEIARGLGRIFLLFLPFLLQLNILWCALFWCIILWGCLTRNEKGVLALCVFLVIFVSPIERAVFYSMESPQVQTVLDMYEINYGERDLNALGRLQLWVEEHPRDRDALFTLALAFKREEGYAAARRYYQKLMNLNPSDPDVMSNLGNLYLALGEPEKAISLYEQAIKTNPSNGVYYFNLSKALSKKSMLLLHDADKKFQTAKKLSPKVIGAHLKIDSPHPNRNVIDQVISLGRLRSRLLHEVWRGIGPSFLVVNVGLRSLSLRFPFVTPLVFLALMILLPYLGKGGAERWRCSLCGASSTQAYAKREGIKKICIRCFRVLKGREIDKDLKERKLKEIKVYKRRTGFYDRLFPLILPGGGHVWKGYNLRGLLFLWVFFVFLGKLYYWKGIVPAAIPSSTYGIYGIYGERLLIYLALGVFYILVLKGAQRKGRLDVSEAPFSLEGIRR